MSEFRQDRVSGRWVIIAPERASRPTDFPVEKRRGLSGGFCPFCEGNEDKTPPEITAIRPDGSAPNTPGWNVRVVPNRFPALSPTTSLQKCDRDLDACMTGFGMHEVIIDSPKHVLSMCEMDPALVRDIFFIYRERLQALARDNRVAYAMIFKNVGAAAGATLEHLHTQLIALPVTPTVVQDEIRNCRSYKQDKHKCLFCSIIEDELAARARIVCDGAHFVALSPFASRAPFEIWILPKKHVAHFAEQPEETYGDLAEVMCTALSRLDQALDSPAYNYLIHTSPFGEHAVDEYHWHIEIVPSVTRMAGFEWGTGFYINPVSPEDATEFLAELKTKWHIHKKRGEL